jgi:hypothetical protein
MVLDKSPDQVKRVKLLAPIVIVGQTLDHVLNRYSSAVQRSELILGCIISGLIINLMGLFFNR